MVKVPLPLSTTLPLLALRKAIFKVSPSASVKPCNKSAKVTVYGVSSESLTSVACAPISVGASLLETILMIVNPVAKRFPPLPWEPPLLSSMLQLICTLAGGVLLELLYAIDCNTSFT